MHHIFRKWRGVVLLLAGLLAAGPAPAATPLEDGRPLATRAFSDAPLPLDATWELLAIHPKNSAAFAGGTLAVQDARGGLIVERPLSPGADASPLLISLPLLDEAALQDRRWPVVVTLRGANGPERTRTVDIPLPNAGSTRAIRILAAKADLPSAAALATLRADMAPSGDGNPPVQVYAVTEQDLVYGPSMALAGADAVLLPERLLHEANAGRVTALLNAGLRVYLTTPDVVAGMAAPDATKPTASRIESGVTWQAAGSPTGGGGLWRCTIQPHQIPVLLPELSQVNGLQAVARPSSGLRWAAALVGPAGVLVMLLLWGMLRRGWVVALAGVWTMAGLTFAGAAYMRSLSTESEVTAGWSQTVLAHGSATVAQERLTDWSPLVGTRRVAWSDGTGAVLMPIAEDTHAYFAWPETRLELAAPTEGGVELATRMEAAVRPRGRLLTFERMLLANEGSPAATWNAFAKEHQLKSTDGCWLVEGHVLRGAQPPAKNGSAEAAIQAAPSFTMWMTDQPRHLSLETWYDLRFQVSHTYWIGPRAAGSAAGDLDIVDLGPAKP